jgi:hypothetical protein
LESLIATGISIATGAGNTTGDLTGITTVGAIQKATAEGTTIVIVSAGKSIPYACHQQPLFNGGAAFF